MAFLDRPGYRIYYEVAGDPRRPALLLIEGMGGDVGGWHRNVPALAAERFVVAHDLHGNARSDQLAGPVSIDDFADDAVALMDELAIERADVWGMSMGGLVAQTIVFAHPARVRTLILGGSHTGGVERVGPRGPIPRLWEAIYAPAFFAEHPEHVAEDRAARAGRPQAADSRRFQREAALAYDAGERLGAIAVPTLVIHGTEDRVLPVENGHRLAARIPGAEVAILEGAGHAFHSERADAVNDLVLDFLRRHRDA
ncbi:MAG: alpha/beta fold hydrolase [Actinomycetota bacterium]